MGVPPHILRDMPESDFIEAQEYHSRHYLPTRRIEMMLARLSAEQALLGGVKDVTAVDYLITIKPDTAPVTTQDARDAIGFKPIAKRRKKVQ